MHERDRRDFIFPTVPFLLHHPSTTAYQLLSYLELSVPSISFDMSAELTKLLEALPESVNRESVTALAVQVFRCK